MRKWTCAAIVTVAACTTNGTDITNEGEGSTDRTPRSHYQKMLDKLDLPSGTFELVGVSIESPYVDLDQLDAASFAAKYSWVPSPGVLRETDEQDLTAGVFMAWGEQYNWPIKPRWRPGQQLPSIEVLEVDARIRGEDVTYQSLLLRDYPNPGDAEVLGDPVLAKLAYAPGPRLTMVEWTNTPSPTGSPPPTDLGIEVDPGTSTLACNSNTNKEEVKWASAKYLADCLAGTDQVQIKFAVHGNVLLTCGAPEAPDGQCYPSSYNYLDNHVAQWRFCDDRNASIDSSDSTCGRRGYDPEGWQTIASSSTHEEIEISWSLCDSGILKLDIEKAQKKAFITRTIADTDTRAIGYAGVTSSYQVIKLDGNWTSLTAIATGLTIAYYAVGTLYITSKFAGWLVKLNSSTQATDKIGPTTVALGLVCGKGPVPSPTPTPPPPPPPPPNPTPSNPQ